MKRFQCLFACFFKCFSSFFLIFCFFLCVESIKLKSTLDYCWYTSSVVTHSNSDEEICSRILYLWKCQYFSFDNQMKPQNIISRVLYSSFFFVGRSSTGRWLPIYKFYSYCGCVCVCVVFCRLIEHTHTYKQRDKRVRSMHAELIRCVLLLQVYCTEINFAQQLPRNCEIFT